MPATPPLRILVLALVGAVVATPAPAAAQPLRTGVAAGVSTESFWFRDAADVSVRSVSLTTLPFAARLPLTAWSRLDLVGTLAHAELRRADGTSASISGPTDTELRLSGAFGGDRVVVSSSVWLPTGRVSHTDAEADVAGTVAADLLPFRISNWGSGGALGARVAVADRFGAVDATAQIGYRVADEFEPLAAEPFVYRPGDELHASLGLGYAIGDATRISLQTGVQRFGSDRLDGRNLFRSGNRYEAIGSLAFAPGPRTSASVYAGAVRRSGATLLDFTPEMPPQTLLVAGGAARLWIGATMVSPSTSVRLIRRDDGESQGVVTGAGASAELPLGSVVLTPTAHLYFGHVLVQENENSNFTGLALGLIAQFGRTRR